MTTDAHDWIPVESAPLNREVLTKIDDENGERNIQSLVQRQRAPDTRRERDSDQQSATDLEDSLLACENGQTIYDVLANYRAVRRTIQRAREVPSND